MKPRVSVIVPVYNTKRYLPQCLDSICSQTIEELEIICVDDGSTDGSGELLDGYALRDPRVRVLHRPNRGYGAAMNAGLEAARGEYIGIVESDDCIQPQMYETLCRAAAENDLDLVKADAYYWIESAGYQHRIHYKHLEDAYDRVLGDEDRNVFFDFYMNIWTGIYKRAFLEEHGIRFHESPGASYQDNGFWIQTLCYCSRAMWLSQAFYLYRQDNPEASVKSRGKMMAMAEEYEHLAGILRERGDDRFLPYCYYYRLLRDRGTFFRVADEYKREFCGQLQKDFAAYKSYIKGNGWLDKWFRGAAKEPDALCAGVIQKKEEIRGRLERAPGVIVYGAGLRGDAVFRGLYNEGYYEKIRCFAVSQDPPEGQLAGRKILQIEEALASYPGALVVVAVVRDSGAYRQMTGRLMELGKEDFLAGTDLEENFYIL